MLRIVRVLICTYYYFIRKILLASNICRDNVQYFKHFCTLSGNKAQRSCRFLFGQNLLHFWWYDNHTNILEPLPLLSLVTFCFWKRFFFRCRGDFYFALLYSTLLHLLPFRIHCVGARMLGSNPGQLRLRNWLPEALTIQLHLIPIRQDLIHNSARSHPLDLIQSFEKLIFFIIVPETACWDLWKLFGFGNRQKISKIW